MGNLGALLPLILIVVMLIFMTRSQKKQQQQRQDVLNSLEIGNRVITIGGLHGTVAEINKEGGTVVLDCEGIFLEFNRSAIATVKPGTTVVNDDAQTTVEVPTNEEKPADDAADS